LLLPATVRALRDIPFLRTAAAGLGSPATLHLDTAANRLCLPETLVASGASGALYSRLNIRPSADFDTLLGILASAVAEGVLPPRPDVLYPALAAAAAKERVPIERTASSKLLWVKGGYHQPETVLAGPTIPKLFDSLVPVARGDRITQAYVQLGASSYPRESHWQTFFSKIGDATTGGLVGNAARRDLREAYWLRGAAGLPQGVDDQARCLLDRLGGLHSLAELRSGHYLEDDFPSLAAALEGLDAGIGFAEVVERSRPFLSSLGLRPLTSVCDTSVAQFGNEVARVVQARPNGTAPRARPSANVRTGSSRPGRRARLAPAERDPASSI
jgi:hypothetical protein